MSGAIDAGRKERSAAARRGTFASRLRKSKSIRTDPLHRSKIIDHFSGWVAGHPTPEIWENQIQTRLTQTVSLLERGNEESLQLARQQVNEQVAQYLKIRPDRDSELEEVTGGGRKGWVVGRGR